MCIFSPTTARSALQTLQSVVKGLAGHQIGVVAGFNDFAMVQDKDMVRLPDGGQAVSHQERRSPRGQTLEGFLDAAFGF